MTTSTVELSAKPSIPLSLRDPGLAEVTRRYPFALSAFLRRRVSDGTYSDAALRQFLPDRRELLPVEGFVADPTGEADLHPAPGVLQAYHNRAAVILTYSCLVYCRFCFRKELVGHAESKVAPEEIESALAYIGAHPEIQDVLLSGGDPLALPNRKLIPLLERLISIPHVRAVRLDSRALNVQPDRIDDELLAFLARHDGFWFYAHMNHPDDINHPDVIAKARQLVEAGVPIFNQCVILAGVNDDAQTLRTLMESCYFNRVLPYNIYVLDRARGAAHFDVPPEKVRMLYQSLADLSGPAQPLLVYVGNDSCKRRIVNGPSSDLPGFLHSHFNR